jgi:putative salt-induced outer membrane protein YdiY
MKIKSIALFTSLAVASGFASAQDAKPFTLDGELGFIFTSGNTETTSANAALNATQELESWSNEYVAKGLYKKDEVNGVETTSAQKLFASAQGNYKLENPNHRLFVFASYEDDRFSSFEYQGTLAAGWNHSVWKDETSEFDYSIGPGYAFAETIDGEDADGLLVRGAFNYRYTISENAKFTQKFSTEVGADNTKSRSESAVTAKLAGGLSMKVALKFDHNSEAAEGRENLDTETSVNLVYTFF